MRSSLLFIVWILSSARLDQGLSFRSNSTQIEATASLGIRNTTTCPVNCSCSTSDKTIACSYIESLPDFSGLPFSEYTTLIVSHSNLGAVDVDNAYLHLPYISNIQMNYCGITKIRLCRTDGSSAAYLKSLQLRDNQLTAVPQTIQSCDSLEDLSLERNFITPAGLGHELFLSMKQLHSLDLSCNNISFIDSEALAFLNSTSLHKLNLEQNLLTRVDATSGLKDVCEKAQKEQRTSIIYLSSGNRLVCDRNLSWVCSYPSCFDSNFFDAECTYRDTSIYEYCNFGSGSVSIIIPLGSLAGVILLSILIAVVARRCKKQRNVSMSVNVGERAALVPPGPSPDFLYDGPAHSQNTP